MPKFQDLNVNRDTSLAWAHDNRESFIGQSMAAVGSRIAQYVAEKGSDNIRPEILEAMGMANKPGAASMSDALSAIQKRNGK